LQLSALRYWTYRLRAGQKASESDSVKLVPVRVEPKDEAAALSPSEIERAKPVLTLELGEARIVVPTGFDRGTLRAVLDILGERQTRGAR
jgi:hypothetical protein